MKTLFLLSLFILSACNPIGGLFGSGSQGKIDGDFHPGIEASLALISISPSNGSTSGGTTLTLSGTGFKSGATVRIGNSSCTSVNFVSDTTLTCTSPAHAAGSVDVTVTNPDGKTASLSAAFSYSSVNSTPASGTAISSGAGTATGTGVSMRTTIGEPAKSSSNSATGMKFVSGAAGISYSP